MEKRSTSQHLKHFYESLYKAISEGQLESCLELHIQIATYLRRNGADHLAERHYLSAQKVRDVLELVRPFGQSSVSAVTMLWNAPGVALAGLTRTPREQVDQWKNGLELRLISVLSTEFKTATAVKVALFGSFAKDLVSEKTLEGLIRNINRHIGHIIDSSSEGYRLRRLASI